MIRSLLFLIFTNISLCILSTAQTLNKDTLVKYHVSKILTYELDSAGQKVLTETRCINKEGLITDFSIRKKTVFDSTLFSIDIDTFKYAYNSDKKLIRELHSKQIINYNANLEKFKNYSWESFMRYKRFYVVSPFSKITVSYIYLKKNKEIINRYYKGKRDGHFEHYSNEEYKFSFDKFFSIYQMKKKFSFYGRRKKYRWLNYSRHDIYSKHTLNLNGDFEQSHISEKFLFNIFRGKNISYSYIKQYKYIYKNSLMIYSKSAYPNYVHTTKAKRIHAKKRIRIIEEQGILEQEKFYEYIIY